MNGKEDKIIIYLEGSSKRFIIPVYQRNYDWKIEHCKQLYNDLIKIVKQKRKSHFFGSIVSVADTEGQQSEYLIIDGQQRLTTVSLILLAIYKLLINGKIRSENSNLGEKIYQEFLVDRYAKENKKIKLKPIKNDQQAFSKLFDDDSEYILDSNLTINYNYFYERIQTAEVSIDELYNALFKLEIINIILNQNDNPQLIFESLNSTGLDLNEGDKIRNYVLMGLPVREQENLYEKYWNKIEELTGYDVSAFIRDYLSIKQQSTPAFRNVYVKFKEYVESRNFTEIEELLIDLLYYAKQYQYLIKANSPWRKLNECIYRLNRIKTTVTRPFLMEILMMIDQKQLSDKDVDEIFIIVENYIFRRAICDLPTNALNKIFLLIHREIIRFDGTDNDYLEKFKYILLNKNGSGSFPDDIEFSTALSEKNIYGMKGENKLYLFERLENFGTLETKAIWNHLDIGDYSIEHIMPQTITKAWIEALGEDYEKIHTTWLHRLANLTLTAYNSKYSNKPFIEKRDMKNGFVDSGLKSNQWLAKQSKWTEDEIKERDNLLLSKASEIWPYISSTFEPPIKQLDTVSLDEDIVFTGMSISKFSLFGDEYPVKSWTDMYHSVLTQLHENDKSILTKLAVSEDPELALSIHFSTHEESFNSFRKINSKILVWTGTDTQFKIKTLKKIFLLFEVEPSELIFYLKESKGGKNHSIRKKYWAYSLPKIREESGFYKNTNPSKENWVNGYFGINGLYVSSIANYDSARVELTIATSEKEENKNIFNFLYSNKETIEASAEKSFIWNRSDDTKVSKIYLNLPDVDISKEADWPKMAEFHAKGSKTIIEAFKSSIYKYFSQ